MSTRQRLLGAGIVLAALIAGGVLLVLLGLVPHRASSGHWAATEWMLQLVKRRAVSMHALGLDPASLDDPGTVLRGAGHFEYGCRPCHGAPDLWAPRIAFEMTPNPPPLHVSLAQWSREELFYIVKHGLKFTGMPAWPAQNRDDEVWAIVAFLLRLRGLDADAYRRLVLGGPSGTLEGALTDLTGPDGPSVSLVASCTWCHGADGLGRMPGAFPKLAGQHGRYLEDALTAFALRQRQSGIMGPIAAGLSERERTALARYFAGLTSESTGAGNPPAGSRAVSIIFGGSPRVPACASCHGPGVGANPAYPALAGQDSAYLVQQLELFAAGHRGGGPYADLMQSVVRWLSPDDFREVAAYYSALSAGALVR